jgi:hypothetical protein
VTKFYKPLNGFHRRAQRSRTRAEVRPTTQLPGAEEFTTASPELRAALAEWHRLAEASFGFARAAKHADLEADADEARHRKELRAALAAGEDVATVAPSRADELRKVATEAIRNHDAAKSARQRLGFDLAPLLEAEAAALVPDVNKRLDAHAAKIASHIDKAREQFGLWAQDFALRRWLSDAELLGGPIVNYDPNTALPREVADALNTLEHHLDSLARLESDEHEVRAFRGDAG